MGDCFWMGKANASFAGEISLTERQSEIFLVFRQNDRKTWFHIMTYFFDRETERQVFNAARRGDSS